MKLNLIRRPSPALVVACLALLISLGGTGYAALKLPRNSVGTAQLKKNAVTSVKVRNHSLRRVDFKAGQLPAGRRGPQGPQGPPGPPGPKCDTGTVDTSNFYTKSDSDSRYVAKSDARPFAWGQVRADGSLRPVSSRVASVVHPSTGLYCVLLSGSPAQSELEGSAVTLAGTTPQALFPHVTNGQGGDCSTQPQPHLSIRFYNSSGTLANARFSFVVP
jgi:hypothetical protein